MTHPEYRAQSWMEEQQRGDYQRITEPSFLDQTIWKEVPTEDEKNWFVQMLL
jgi:hypothetical protein